jgi:hypothetical protein
MQEATLEASKERSRMIFLKSMMGGRVVMLDVALDIFFKTRGPFHPVHKL